MNPFLDWDRVTFSHGVWLENYVVLLRKYSIEMNCPFSVIFAADSGMWQMGVSIIWSGAIHNTAVPIQGRLIQTMNSKMNEILQQVVFFSPDIRRGSCWMTVRNGRCEEEVRSNITKTDCCASVGVAWGSPCEVCPPPPDPTCGVPGKPPCGPDGPPIGPGLSAWVIKLN